MDFNPVPKSSYKKKFACERCKKVLASKFSMQRHAEDCGVHRSRIKCQTCQKSLKNLDCLKKHEVICLGKAKKVACALCDELFCSQFSLKRHMWRFHSTKDNETQNQDICHLNITVAEKKENTTQKTKILNFSQFKNSKETAEEYKYRYCVLEDAMNSEYEYLDSDTNPDETFHIEYS